MRIAPPRHLHLHAAVAVISIALAACRGDAAPAAESAAPPSSEILDRITRPGVGPVHLVRVTQLGDGYGFDPAELTIAPGDLVRFVMAGSQPESIVFDAAAATPEAAIFIREMGLDRGVLLTDPGQAHDVLFTDAPPGGYPYHSLPHAARGMRGTVTVAE